MAAPRENTVTVTTANASMDMDPQAMDIATKLQQPPEKNLTVAGSTFILSFFEFLHDQLFMLL